MRITTDTCYTLHSEVERFYRKAGLLQEGHDEAAETTVDVKANLVFLRELTKGDDVVLAAVGEVNCRAYDLSTVNRNRYDLAATIIP